MNECSKALMLVQQLVKLYQRYSSDVCRRFSLSQAELDIIAFINNNPEFDTAKDICELRMLKKSIVSQSLDKLVKRGYIEKLPDPSDRRLLHICFTPAAAECLDEIESMQQNYFSAIFSCYTEEDSMALLKLLEKLESNIFRLTGVRGE